MDGPLVFILTLLAWFAPLSIIASGYIRIIYSVKSNLFSPRQDNVISAEITLSCLGENKFDLTL